MGRIMAIDYGLKRCGIAVTDPLQIIASPLTTVHAKDLLKFIEDYLKTEIVDCIVIGKPRQMDNTNSQMEPHILNFIKKLKIKIPEAVIERYDERFTSMIAQRSMLENGLKKSDRRNKELVDMVSASLILQSFMSSRP